MGLTTASGLAGCSDGTTTPETTAATGETETIMPTDTTAETTTETSIDQRGGDGLVTVEGDKSVSETVKRIKTAVEETPLTLVTTIDHAANAETVDADLPPTTLLIFGNPAVGTPLMQERRSVAIDLPQKMLVWADGDTVQVTYNDPQYLARRHGIESQEERLSTIANVLERLATGDKES